MSPHDGGTWVLGNAHPALLCLWLAPCLTVVCVFVCCLNRSAEIIVHTPERTTAGDEGPQRADLICYDTCLRQQAADWSTEFSRDQVQDVAFKSVVTLRGQTCCFDPHNESLSLHRNRPSSWSSQNATCCCGGQINPPPRIVPDPRWAWPPLGSLTPTDYGIQRRVCWIDDNTMFENWICSVSLG